MSREKGQYGESIALASLLNKGYSHIQSNFLSRWGELDLIMEDCDGTIVIVEVKAYKPNSLVHPIQAITKTKLDRMIKTLRYFWVCRPHLVDRPYRIDVMVVRHSYVESHHKNIVQL